MTTVALFERTASRAIPQGSSAAGFDRYPGARDRYLRMASMAASTTTTSSRPVMRILVVSQNREVQDELRTVFEQEGREVLLATQTAGIVEMIGRAEVDLVLSDASLPDDGGITLLQDVRAQHPDVFTGLLTSLHTPRVVSEAISDCLVVPVDPMDARALLRRAEAKQSFEAMQAVHAAMADEPQQDGTIEFRGMYGTTPVMRDVFKMIARVGRTDVTVLVTGESGTGKELVARALHEESARRNKPFVALNCSALPSELVESELFGHTRGAFTGAVKDRGGLFEAANGGTLFLDEIGDLGPLAQAKVLRALENGEVMRVGGTRSTRVDVRVIAATNRPLDEMVTDGRFREDLLYRLKVISLALPPLRDRTSDIPLLATHFLQVFADRHGLPLRPISERAREILLQYEWPGNVRELRNVIEGALVMCDGAEIDDCDLPAALSNPRPTIKQSMLDQAADLPFVEAREKALREFDRAFLSAALARNNGNIARTARALGLHRQSLQKLLARRDLRQ